MICQAKRQNRRQKLRRKYNVAWEVLSQTSLRWLLKLLTRREILMHIR